MTMNREMLLERLQNQYLTRQEVLFRLPLNISIDSFWPELVQRRKLSGVVLPLHRADGKPLWYVLTNRMIAASERLCALALDSADQIDPYKAELTGAMTECSAILPLSSKRKMSKATCSPAPAKL